MAYETIETIANAGARPTPSDGMIRYQQDIQSCIVYDGGATAWKVFTPNAVDYDLDGGDNVISTTPLFHFDADRVNGSDDSENPANAQVFDTTVDADNPTGGVWTSRAGSVVTVAQSSGSLQPTYYTAGTNSKPYFSVATDLLLLDPANTTCGALTMFAVMNRTAGSYNLAVGGDTTAGAGNTWINYSANKDDYLLYPTTGYATGAPPTIADGVGNGSTAEADYDALTRMFLYTRSEAMTTSLFVDGNNAGITTATAYVPCIVWTHLFKSKTYSLTGQFYECAVWEHELSVADKNVLISYVNSKYDLDPGGADAGKGWNASGNDKLARPTFS